MDNQFTTLTRSYYDNFLQYKLTGSEPYQKAYMGAEEGIQNILTNLRNEVNVQNDSISTFYKSNVTEKINSTKSEIESTQKAVVTNKDKAATAELRYPVVVEQKQAINVPRPYLIATGTLFVISALLMAL